MLFTALDISTSGLQAQRTRMQTCASNVANLSTSINENGERKPYQPRYVKFEATEQPGTPGLAGVRVESVVQSTSEPQYRYDPDNPEALQSGPYAGCVPYPNVDLLGQMTDAMEAVRSYEANLGVFEMSKDIAEQTLRILV